jgi:hypothetical protein
MKKMKRVTTLTMRLSILCTATLMHTYPNKIYIENNTGYKLSFIIDYPRTAPKTAAEYWGSEGDRVEKIGPYQNAQIEEANKDKTYSIIKVSPVDWEFHPRMSGQRRPVWHKFAFNRIHMEPIYLIYEDEGFTEITQQQWNDHQSGERKPRHWHELQPEIKHKDIRASVGEEQRTKESRPLIGGSASLPPEDSPEYQKENRPK